MEFKMSFNESSEHIIKEFIMFKDLSTPILIESLFYYIFSLIQYS